VQPAGHQITWAEFCEAFRAHYIPDGVMAMKLEEFLNLKQGDQYILQYVGKFNHLSQYAIDQVSTDANKELFYEGIEYQDPDNDDYMPQCYI
jgi:hypothetical protein